MRKLRWQIIILIFTLSTNALYLLADKKTSIPRPEYPRPQFERSSWINLNGPWSYTFDHGKSGIDRGFRKSKGFENTIIVPFCPESSLSGVSYKDFIASMWYQRTISIPPKWTGKRVLLHFGAVDYNCTLYINGEQVSQHWGGTSSFTFDITPHVKPGIDANLVLHVEDDLRAGTQAGGKQCLHYASEGVTYTRTTGIWQTVWAEAVDPHGLEDIQLIADLDNQRFIITPHYYSVNQSYTLQAKLFDGSKMVGQARTTVANQVPCIIPVKNPKTWSPEDPFLYDVLLEVLDAKGKVIDKVNSYAGMRKIHVEGNRLFLNNKKVYLRFVLDQGFYPDGIWTAPSDAALKRDIELSMAAGFNGARLHQKVFEERFHYWADKLGYLTWAEASDWGNDLKNPITARNFLSEWEEIVVRDRNHPSIIAWTPFNETGWVYREIEADFLDDMPKQYWEVVYKNQHDRLVRDAYRITRALDSARPINDASGHVHVITDLYTSHCYTQNIDEFRKEMKAAEDKGHVYREFSDRSQGYRGQPYFLDEYGGIKWAPGGLNDNKDSEPDRQRVRSLETFYERLEGLTNVILETKYMSGYTYTQLTDVEQEINGIYYYDRTPKFDMKRINKIFSKIPDNN